MWLNYYLKSGSLLKPLPFVFAIAFLLYFILTIKD